MYIGAQDVVAFALQASFLGENAKNKWPNLGDGLVFLTRHILLFSASVGTFLFVLRLINRDEIWSARALCIRGCLCKISARLANYRANGTLPTAEKWCQVHAN